MQRVSLDFPEAVIRHRHPLGVRVTDMNYGRHLGHDAVVSLMHEARVHALADLGLCEDDLGGCPCVAADLAVQYQTESRWPDVLVAETAIPEPGCRAITVFHRLRREADERIVATARLTLMLVDPDGGRPVAIPDGVRHALAGAA